MSLLRSAAFGLLVCAALSSAEPVITNPSFEADPYARAPGYARANGGTIAGWRWTGNVGLNPTWSGKKPAHAFTDNGRVPQGRQALFLQNVATASQTVAGFEKGKRYRVVYFENARHNNAPARNPRLVVTLGGDVVVSEHAVAPVEAIGSRALPYCRVESAVFTAPSSGAFELVFRTTFGDRVALLIDQVRIVEVQ